MAQATCEHGGSSQCMRRRSAKRIHRATVEKYCPDRVSLNWTCRNYPCAEQTVPMRGNLPKFFYTSLIRKTDQKMLVRHLAWQLGPWPILATPKIGKPFETSSRKCIKTSLPQPTGDPRSSKTARDVFKKVHAHISPEACQRPQK